VTEAELKLMMKNMLTDRFKLQIHKETRPLSGYALLVSSKGPKLDPGTSDDPKKSGLDGRPGRIIPTNMPSRAWAWPMLFQEISDSPWSMRRALRDASTLSWCGHPDRPTCSCLDILHRRKYCANGLLILMARRFSPHFRNNWDSGWKLKVPTEVLVIDSVQKPSEN
jgi:hypothetical protein